MSEGADARDQQESGRGNSVRIWPRGSAIISVPVTTVWDSPTAARDIDAPIVADVPLPHRWMSNLDTAGRLGLMGRATTQALLGEPVIVVAEHGGWSEVRLPWQPTSADPLGYPGFVPSAHIGEDDPLPADTTTPVQPTFTTTRLSRRSLGPRKHAEILSIGSIGGTIVHNSGEPDNTDRAESASPLSLLSLLEQFLGVGYLWSGLSGWGVDCSGLIHVCARAAGLRIPRDSIDQCAAIERGDIDLPLLFFAHPRDHERAGRIRHVAWDLGDTTMLHAPRAGFVVEVISQATSPYGSDRVLPGRRV